MPRRWFSLSLSKTKLPSAASSPPTSTCPSSPSHPAKTWQPIQMALQVRNFRAILFLYPVFHQSAGPIGSAFQESQSWPPPPLSVSATSLAWITLAPSLSFLPPLPPPPSSSTQELEWSHYCNSDHVYVLILIYEICDLTPRPYLSQLPLLFPALTLPSHTGVLISKPFVSPL